MSSNMVSPSVQQKPVSVFRVEEIRTEHVDDPSAGSPTETLLRLLLPLNDQV